MQQLGGVTFSHEKAVSTVPLEILQISERRGTILPFIIFSSDAYFPHVRFNDNPKYPQILEIVEEVSLPKPLVDLDVT